MSDWKRSTREVIFEGLNPAMVTAIRAHVELYNLGSILSDAVMCIQTDSEKAKKGLFGKAENVSQGAVVTPRWLVWCVVSSQGPAVLSSQLTDIVVQDYAQTPFAKMVPDSGLQVTGKFTDVPENGSAFIGLDDGLAAKKFRQVVIESVQAAKK